MTDTNPPGQAVGLWADDANITAEIDEAVPRCEIGAPRYPFITPLRAR
jgi:hypothetical protein